ncbi:Ig-like domain-containing protein [Enterococcus sp. AZ126]|uniref:Ig-like domain-containing protein n=1 Tax=Enterococcus sp. AZ126 TaxID=2774635 RepID=UPI003F2279BB
MSKFLTKKLFIFLSLSSFIFLFTNVEQGIADEVYKVEDEAYIPDENLRKGVIDNIRIAGISDVADNIVRKSDMGELSQVTVWEDVSDLTGLENLTRVTGVVVDLKKGNVSDLTPLKNIQLNQLNMPNHNVSDLSPLRNQKKMHLFSLPNNEIHSLADLNMTNMRTIDVSGNHISDLSGIYTDATMVMALDQTIINEPISFSNKISLNLVKPVSNYSFSDVNGSIFDISLNGKVDQAYTKINWQNLPNDTKEVTYAFDRQYTWSIDSSKKNMVYFSGKVIQPFFDEVTIPDKNLRKGVLEALLRSGVNISNDIITEAHMKQLTSVYAWGVKDLTGLEYAKNEEGLHLFIANGEVKDLTPISDIRLTKFIAPNNDLSDLSLLKNQQLEEIVVSGNNLSSLEGLNTVHLKLADISNNQIADISSLTSVKKIDAANQEITLPTAEYSKDYSIDLVKSIETSPFKYGEIGNVSNNGSVDFDLSKIRWEVLTPELKNVSYTFFKLENNYERELKFSGKVIQPFY